MVSSTLWSWNGFVRYSDNQEGGAKVVSMVAYSADSSSSFWPGSMNLVFKEQRLSAPFVQIKEFSGTIDYASSDNFTYRFNQSTMLNKYRYIHIGTISA